MVKVRYIDMIKDMYNTTIIVRTILGETREFSITI